MAKGTKTGGGSRKGIPNKATAKREAEIAASGLTPLDYMLSVMRAPCPPELLAKIEEQGASVEVIAAVGGWHAQRMEAAKAAAPYVHPKLAQMELTGKDGEDLIPKGPVDPMATARSLLFLVEKATRQEAVH